MQRNRQPPPSRRPRASRGQALLVAGVALLVAVAAVDAVWNGGAPDRDEVAAELREAGVRGTLVYTDPACALHAVSLPGFEAVALPEGPDVGCSLELSPDGRRVAPGSSTWGTSAFYALCRGEVVDVYWPPSGRPQFLARSPDGAYVALDPALLVRADGTGVTLPPVLENTHAPAFSPDGRWLALAARGAVFLVELDALGRYDAGGASPPLVKLPIDARDLGWSG